MPPESEILFGRLKNVALDVVRNRYQEASLELEAAYKSKDFGRIAEIAEEINKLKLLTPELEGTSDPITAVFKKHGISIDIPLGISEVLQEKRGEGKPAEVVVHPMRKPDKYIDDATPTMFMVVIQKDREGKFTHNNLSSIARLIVKPKGKEALKDALNYVSTEKSIFAADIREMAKRHSAQTMAEVLHSELGEDFSKVKNPKWKRLYGEITEGYGRLSPQKFIETVLNRFHKEYPTKPVPEKIRRSQISPKFMEQYSVIELVACSAITREGTLQQIQKELLGGSELQNFLEKHGWEKGITLLEAIEKSRDKICKERANMPITHQEGKFARQIISNFIWLMNKDRRGWNRLSYELPALRSLYHLMAEFQGSGKKVQQFIDILFPSKTVVVDSQGMVANINSRHG